MTTFEIKINSMYTVNTNNPQFVVNVNFTVTGTDGTHTAYINDSLQFISKNKIDGFTPYSSLTQDIVMSWISNSGKLQNLESCVQGQINSIVTPVTSPQNTPLPWSN